MKIKPAIYKTCGEYIGRLKMSTFIKKKSGATAAEYGLISGAMGLIIIIAWTRAYASISSVMEYLIQNLTG